MYKSLASNGVTTQQIFNKFDRDKSGYISKQEFKTSINDIMGPLITNDEAEILAMLADRNNSGAISLDEFDELMSHRVNETQNIETALDSAQQSRDTMSYVLHKCLELRIDLYK
jgi:Ca2+-binding EF-hand superfamily protein